jgi:N-acetylmuramoyl-L-alanine amidase
MYKLRNVIRGIGLAVAVVFPLLADSVAEAAAPQVQGVRIGVYATKTRLVLDLDGTVDFRTFSLPNPWRVVVDLSEVTWSSGVKRPPRDGLVTGMRFGLFRPGTSRVVVDTAGPVQVTKSFVLPPSKPGDGFRLVVDMTRTTQETFMKGYRKPAPVPAPPQIAARPPDPAPSPVVPKPRPGRKLIMIDPGHGGVDPGAMSRSGVWEKHIVLAFAQELQRQLLATGRFRVQLTRDGDVFIRLRDRIALARKAGADLFISVHADSIGNRNVRGTSVYTLSENASDKEAAALATKENKSDVIAGIDLDEQPDEVVNILIDLAQRETMNESAVFAKTLVEKLALHRRMLRNTHRFAGFAVLKAPDIPSVLVELGYLSNREDERMLRSPKTRGMMAGSIAEAISQYFERQQAAERR